MADRPEIKPGDWIRIGNTDCVVANVREHSHALGDCEVVFNPSKPTNHDVVWTGGEWKFVESGNYGGYADKYPRLSEFVSILKRGRWA